MALAVAGGPNSPLRKRPLMSMSVPPELGCGDGRRARLGAYLLVTAVAAGVAFYLGERHYNPPGCTDVGECNQHLGTVWGVFWSVKALVLTVAIVGLFEVAFRLGRRHRL